MGIEPEDNRPPEETSSPEFEKNEKGEYLWLGLMWEHEQNKPAEETSSPEEPKPEDIRQDIRPDKKEAHWEFPPVKLRADMGKTEIPPEIFNDKKNGN